MEGVTRVRLKDYKSIIVKDMTTCIYCGKPATDVHHAIHGHAGRPMATKYGLVVGLCRNCHTVAKHAVHNNPVFDEWLMGIAQRRFEEVYPDLNYNSIFGKSHEADPKKYKYILSLIKKGAKA